VVVVVAIVVVQDGAYEGWELHWMRRFRILLDNSLIASKQEFESPRWLQGRIDLKFSTQPSGALNG